VAAAVPLDHLAVEQERATQERGRLAHLAGCEQTPDLARGDGLALGLDERHHACLELVPRTQQLGVAVGAVAEAEVLAYRDLLGPQLPDQHVLDEALGAAGGELAVERDHDQLLDSEPRDQVALDGQRRDQLGQRLGMENGQGMRFERQDGVAALDHLAMAEMNAVEGADRDLARAALSGRQVGEPGQLHSGANTTAG
jgi:hypothetical protein